MKIEKVLFNSKKIEKSIITLANKISADYKDKDLVVIGVMKGAFIFTSDLIRKLDIPMTVDFIRASSYGNSTKSSGKIKLNKKISINIKDKDVLIIEDIFDTGKTLTKIINEFAKYKPASLKTCVLIKKETNLETKIKPDYFALAIPDVFIVGYGLDCNEKFRNLPNIVTLTGE